jgi:hypothetical protein
MFNAFLVVWLLALSCPSRCNNSASTGQIFMKFDILIFFENLSRKLKFHLNQIRRMVLYMNTNVHFLLYLAQFFQNDKCFRQNLWRKSEHILCCITFFFYCSLYEITVEKYCRARQATKTHWEYVIHNDSSLQQWSHKCATMIDWSTVYFE